MERHSKSRRSAATAPARRSIDTSRVDLGGTVPIPDDAFDNDSTRAQAQKLMESFYASFGMGVNRFDLPSRRDAAAQNRAPRALPHLDTGIGACQNRCKKRSRNHRDGDWALENWHELEPEITRIAARLTPDEMLRHDLAQEMRIDIWQAPVRQL